MAGYADDDIKNAAEIREWLTKLISEKQNELERLQIMLSLIDSVLKQGSFKTAANLNLNKRSFSNEQSSNAYSENKKKTLFLLVPHPHFKRHRMNPPKF